MTSPQEPKHPAIAETIRSYRLKGGFTQEEVALKAGINNSEISNLERGIRNPKWETMKKVAKGLGVPCWEMVKHAEEIDREQEAGADE
ncbi:MAG TPA: helix-turn-helix transcriptional regulator [Solirubrobacterales bacterium]|nr:helix-turn-helix transcriptional regulator [Solirubrobacterales bacterium]